MKENLTAQVWIRITPEFKEWLKQKAEEEGVKPATFARKLLKEGAKNYGMD